MPWKLAESSSDHSAAGSPNYEDGNSMPLTRCAVSWIRACAKPAGLSDAHRVSPAQPGAVGFPCAVAAGAVAAPGRAAEEVAEPAVSLGDPAFAARAQHPGNHAGTGQHGVHRRTRAGPRRRDKPAEPSHTRHAGTRPAVGQARHDILRRSLHAPDPGAPPAAPGPLTAGHRARRGGYGSASSSAAGRTSGWLMRSGHAVGHWAFGLTSCGGHGDRGRRRELARGLPEAST
jgi:hypothetical protein